MDVIFAHIKFVHTEKTPRYCKNALSQML